ncbi:hypothetical protein AB0J86_32140 [Micromonospora sp. NPDC049559]|uniref:hypothetical protein n=1 Tax=Micromonospora sp. NPDC049559 TaxID=3155923 RepID=UPI00341C7A26
MRFRPIVIATTLVAALVASALGPTGPARAATADRWGYAYVDNPTAPVWTVLDPTRQWGSWKTAFPGLSAEGMWLAPGRFLVKFPQVGTGSRGNVHVTPVNRTGHYCDIVRWYQSGVDEIVDVQCFKPGGARDDTPFTVLWTLSTGVLPAGSGSYASLQYGAGGLVQWYNSTGGGVAVVPGPPGQYQVRLGGVGSLAALAGNLQVSAVHPNAAPRRCKVFSWSASGTDIIATVFCFDATGVLASSEFTLSYHRERAVFGSFGPPKYFGYVWSAGAGQTNFNYPAGGFGFNGIGAIAPPGRYLVKYPFLGLAETHSQVTAFGEGPHYCHLTQPWSHVGSDAEVDVLCFDNAGNPAPYRFFNSFTSWV